MPQSSKPSHGSRRSSSLVPSKPPSSALAVPDRLMLGDHEIRPIEVLEIPERHTYSDGPWETEPDRVAWIDAQTGYPCLILRQETGALAGYVAVSPSHPLWAFEKDAIPTDLGLEAHLGIDYAALCQEGEPAEVRICHPHEISMPVMRKGQQRPGERDSDDAGSPAAWWFGFICDKPCDYLPEGYSRNLEEREDGPRIYRDLAYVGEQTIRLARQLKALEGDPLVYCGNPADRDVPVAKRSRARIKPRAEGGRHE